MSDNIYQWQRKITTWINKNFPNNNTTATYMGMIEEAGEIARIITKREQGIRGYSDPIYCEQELRKEMADLFIKLCDAAQFEGIDLQEAIEERWETIRFRDWKKNPMGHGKAQA